MFKGFESWHPFSQIIYFGAVIGITVIFMHPMLIIMTFLYGISLGCLTSGKKFLKMLFIMYIPVALIGIVINPLFSHEGMTIITYFPDGNPLTLESVIFGVVSGVMIGSICIIFYTFNKVITADIIIYLTGRILPHISLIIAITLRFTDEFKKHFAELTQTQKALGIRGRKFKKIIMTFSAMVTWAFENSIIRSDSMRVRGYGSRKKRTSYSLYRFSANDMIRISIIIVCTLTVIIMFKIKMVCITYYPYFEMSGNSIAAGLLFGLICAIPVFDIVYKELLWKYLVSKI